MRNAVPLLAAALAVTAGCGANRDGDLGEVPGDDDAPAADGGPVSTDAGSAATGNAIEHVFVIVMENKDWSTIAGNPAAPYINDTLLPGGAHAEAYVNLPGLHPSEPNYIWLEGGATFGMITDADPSASNSSASPHHLVNLLEDAGVTWKTYQEDMPEGGCPLSSSGFYAAKHNPFVFFQDVTDGNDPASPRCIEHVRPMTELQADLDAGAMARYVFLTPNLCNDMHGGSGCPAGDPIQLGDSWLAETIPAITSSPIYQAGHAAILVTWDESAGGDQPIGMIVISPHARVGHASTVVYSHSSTLRTLQEIFGVAPLLGDAANATSLADLFAAYP